MIRLRWTSRKRQDRRWNLIYNLFVNRSSQGSGFYIYGFSLCTYIHKAPFGNRMRKFDARFSPITGYLSALLRLLYWQLLAVIAQKYVPLEFLALQTGGDKVPWCILISFVFYTRKLYLALLREAERGYGLQTPGRRHRPLDKTLQYYHSSCIFFRNKATLLVWQRSCIYMLQRWKYTAVAFTWLKWNHCKIQI